MGTNESQAYLIMYEETGTCNIEHVPYCSVTYNAIIKLCFIVQGCDFPCSTEG